MNKAKLALEYTLFDSEKELSGLDRDLFLKAAHARLQAYTPYSRFKVGAAILLANGEVVLGCNQENGSFPAGLCAERVALYQAGARFPGVPIKTLAIVAAPDKEEAEHWQAAPPCGECRQVMLEFENRQNVSFSLLFRVSNDKIVKIDGVSQLLPFAFDAGFLK